MKEAAADATSAMDLQPNLIDAHFLRAVCRFHLQDVTGGSSDFDEAVRLGLDPKMAATWRLAFYPNEAGGPAALP
jgi:hypothetical protein